MKLSGQDSHNESTGSILGIIGGSGLCSLSELNILKKVKIKTIYGYPSDEIMIGKYGGCDIAFLPRHGSKHSIPPHRVPYKANIAALREIGVRQIIGTCIAGSLQERIKPGVILTPDQFVNLTWGRDDHFEQDNKLIHLPMAMPYCESTRRLILDATDAENCNVVERGTVAVIQGPRFSTIAESKWLSSNGWDIVNMTQYPECYFARELGICYAAIAAITDYDVGLGLSLSMDPKNMEKIISIFRENIKKTERILLQSVRLRTNMKPCSCADNLIEEYYKMK